VTGNEAVDRAIIAATRSTIASCSSVGGSTEASNWRIFSIPSAGASSGAIDAASRIASASGQKVIPSPYGRQRPRISFASPTVDNANSRMSRLLPTRRRRRP
jgi:hypothetical protein